MINVVNTCISFLKSILQLICSPMKVTVNWNVLSSMLTHGTC